MAAIILPRKHYTQPHGRVEVAPEWADSLIDVFTSDSLITAGSLSRQVHKNGLALSRGTLNGGRVSGRRLVAGLQHSTAIAVASMSGAVAGTSGRVFYCERSDSLQIYKFGLAASSISAVSFVVRNRLSNLINNVTTIPIPPQRRNFCTTALVTNGPSERRIYCSGQSATNTTNIPIDYTTANDVRICGDAIDNTESFSGGVFLVVLYGRAMVDDEIDEIDANPWRIFRADPVRIYSLPPVLTIPTLSSPGVTDITATAARPQVTLTY